MFDSYFNFMAGLEREASLTASLAVLVLVIGYVVTFGVERGKSPENKRFWRLTVRHSATAVFVLGLFVIWRQELQTLLLALGAATAGFMLAFREQWLSLLAFWVRVVKRTYSLDDFIEIDGHRGRVTDITWLTTKLAETTSSKEGLSYTGRVLHVPNNRMLLAPLMVEALTGEYTVHSLKVHLPLNADILGAEALLLKVAERNCEPFFAEAERHMAALRMEEAMDTPTVRPRVRIQIAELGEASLLLRMVVPFKDRARIDQSILRDFLRNTTPAIWPKTKK